MTIQQFYYTSCQQGADGIQGFQVNAKSPGIDRSQIDAGLPLSLYRPGPSAPPIPTPDQVQALPVAVGYRSFGSYAVLFHSRYLGADFTGRQGNYFAHVLVLDAPDRDLAGTLPVQVWGGDGWCWSPVENPELPVLPQLPQGRLGAWSVGDHLRADGLPQFGSLLSAVQDGLGRGSGRVVVVAPRAEDVARAIAAATRSLPPALAADVSFTTFTSAPGDADVLVVGTSPDVAIPSSPFGDQTVVRLGTGPAPAGPGDRTGRYARVAEACWRRSDDEAQELVALAASIQPPLQAAELDEFSHLAELVVPDSPSVVPDLLPALEFGLRRWPVVLRPRIWDRVELHLARTARIEDVARWSAVLTSAQARSMTPPAGVEDRYLAAALTAFVGGGLDPAGIWMPTTLGDRQEQTILKWAKDTLDESPTFPTATAVLRTLGRLGVRLPDHTLRHLADRVVLPQLVDPSTSETAAQELRRMSASDRVLPLVCELMESRVEADEVFDAVVEELPVSAAELLAPFAARHSRCALAFAVVQARMPGGSRGPVSVLSQALREQGSSPSVVQRFVDLLWTQPPSVADAVSICRTVGADTLAATAVPKSLVDRLIADAEEPGLQADHGDLAAELAKEPVFATLGAGQQTVRAVMFGAFFYVEPRYGKQSVTAACDAVLSTGSVTAPIRRWLLETVAGWILSLADAEDHAEVLRRVLDEGGSTEFIGAYRFRLIEVLRDGRPGAVAAVLPALAYLATVSKDARVLLDTTGAVVLNNRKRRDLEQIGRELSSTDRRLRPMLRKMGRKAPDTWPEWWEQWQEAHLHRSLVGRLLSRRRTAKAAD